MDLLTIVAFFAVLGPLVLVHELGHFIVAKLTGVHIEEFGLGYPPRLLRLWQGPGRLWIEDTEIVVPRGFRLARLFDEGEYVRAVVERGATDARPTLRSIETVELPQDDAEIGAVEAGAADAGAAVELGAHTGVPARASAPAGPGEAQLEGLITRLERGTEYTLNVIPLGGFVRPKGEDDPTIPGGLAAASKRVRLAVLVAGAGMNLVAAFALLTAGFMAGWPEIRTDQPVAVHISSVMPGSPAEQAGVQPGDVVTAINGQSLQDINVLRDVVDTHIQSHPGEPLVMTVQRDGQALTLSLVPRANPPAGQGKMGVQIEQEYQTEIVHYNLFEAMDRGARAVGTAIGFFVQVPYMVVRGLLPVEAVRPVSIVGISQLGADAIKQSRDIGQWWPYLQLTAFVSVALAISNLLPIPALDGGRILFVLIEAVRGRRIPPERETAIHFVGMAMLLVLMMVLVVQDILFPLART